MQATKLHSILLATLVLSCHLIAPIVEAMHHQNNDNGLAVLLAAGLLAKLLRHHHKHEEHHIHIPVPVHHEHHEHHGHHHGSGSARVLVHQPAPFHHLYGGAVAASHMYPQVMYAQPAARYPPHAPY